MVLNAFPFHHHPQQGYMWECYAFEAWRSCILLHACMHEERMNVMPPALLFRGPSLCSNWRIGIVHQRVRDIRWKTLRLQRKGGGGAGTVSPRFPAVFRIMQESCRGGNPKLETRWETLCTIRWRIFLPRL